MVEYLRLTKKKCPQCKYPVIDYFFKQYDRLEWLDSRCMNGHRVDFNSMQYRRLYGQVSQKTRSARSA